MEESQIKIYTWLCSGCISPWGSPDFHPWCQRIWQHPIGLGANNRRDWSVCFPPEVTSELQLGLTSEPRIWNGQDKSKQLKEGDRTQDRRSDGSRTQAHIQGPWEAVRSAITESKGVCTPQQWASDREEQWDWAVCVLGVCAILAKAPVLDCVAGCVSALCALCELCDSTSWSSFSAWLMAELAKGSRTAQIRLAWSRPRVCEYARSSSKGLEEEEPTRSWTALSSATP